MIEKELVAKTLSSNIEKNDTTNLVIASTSGPSNTTGNNDRRKSNGRIRVRRDRSKAYKHIKKLEHELKITKMCYQKYKTRYYHLLNSKADSTPTTTNNLTPRSKT